MNTPLLHLDFVRRAPAAGVRWMLLALAVALVLPVSELYAQASAARGKAQQQFDMAQRRAQEDKRQSGHASAPPDAADMAKAQRANAVIDQLTVPWDELFDALQGADARGVAVLALAPNARDRSLRMAGEARRMDDLLAYVSRLSERPGLAQVHLLGYSTVVREGVPRVTFTLVASWKAAP